METTIIIPQKTNAPSYVSYSAKPTVLRTQQTSKLEKWLVSFCKQLTLFYLACITIKKPVQILKAYRQLMQLRRQTWGAQVHKMYKVDGRYYNNLYNPGWPSAAYNAFLKDELLRHAFPLQYTGRLSMVFFAITRKCPLRCEHCFEWDNLNKKETFTREELIKIVDLYQQQGAIQIHFSGGEPMVRIHDLVEVIKHAKKRSECFVLTSGFNLTATNAKRLKEAGCKGVVVSIDHYIPELHNGFRRHASSFEQAVNGVQHALHAGLVVTLSICVTKSFIDGGHLMPYMQFAKTLGAHFVQLLEPKNIGHYANKEVLLEETHILQLEQFFKSINSDKKYKDFPFVMYHGFHQRRVGCYAGSRSIYIDSAGDVNACPFCHTKSYNVGDILRAKRKQTPMKENRCPRFGKIA
ncbi:radical SAM protein [Ilyomonas limi]|uniref:Radical SAM protein n=1 Tax=Ilyomonas limi TaxID=2575867 RepID=A0A4U3L6I0_9BACT|nr:radical SAM protein [Ilyomonas limi]TKK69326.1 radical SAM protein [Ilyomonas limi]